MAWDFIKKIVGNKEEEKAAPAEKKAAPAKAAAPAAAPAAVKPQEPAAPAKPKLVPPAAPEAAKPAPAPVKEKPASEKTDDELAAELDKMSPEILKQAKEPQMRALIISIYRKMLIDKVDINDDKEVKKWMKKHPEVLQGGETVRVETVRREEPKVGRNDPCPCGSGKKYKKCCGAGK
jgi:leucyl aminopeptidase (aminopeptidase T)